MVNRPISVTITLSLVLLNALLWLIFGIIVAVDAHPALPDIPFYKGLLAFLAFFTAGILAGLFFLLAKGDCIAYFAALGALAIISLSLIFDQFGLPDLVILLMHSCPLILLIKDRQWYLQSRSPIANSF